MRCLHYGLCVALLLGTVFSSPIQNRTQLTDGHNSAQASDKAPIASGNVYGTDADSTQDGEAGDTGSGDEASAGQDEAGNGKDKNQRGYNQGYSYNTGIKPYTTGYTYYQPFGDAAKEQQPGGQGAEGEANAEEKPLPVKSTAAGKKAKAGGEKAAQPMPVDLSNIFDDNGLPNLDNLKLPPPPKGVKVQPLKFEPITTTTPRPVVPANFDGFDFNQLMGGSMPGQQAPQQQAISTPQNDNMFDFTPPSNGNFDFAPNGQNTMGQGDPQLMMGGDGLGNVGNSNSNTPGGNNNANNFGLGDQQVPSEIVNLNNAFGAGPTNTNGAGSDDLSNMVLGNLDGSQQQQPQQQPMMDFGEFGSAAQQNPEQSPQFPFGFNF